MVITLTGPRYPLFIIEGGDLPNPLSYTPKLLEVLAIQSDSL